MQMLKKNELYKMPPRRKSIVAWQTRCKSLPFPRPSDDTWIVPANLFDHSVLTNADVTALLLKRIIPILEKMNPSTFVYNRRIHISNNDPRAEDSHVRKAMELLDKHDTVVIRGSIPEHAFVLLAKKNGDGEIESILVDPNGTAGDPKGFNDWKDALQRAGNKRLAIARIPEFNRRDDIQSTQYLREQGIRTTGSIKGYCATISWLFILDYVCAGPELLLDDVDGHFARLYRDIQRGDEDGTITMILYARSLGYHLCLLLSDSSVPLFKPDGSQELKTFDSRKVPPPEKVQLLSVRRSAGSIDAVKVGRGVTDTTAHRVLNLLKDIQHLNIDKTRTRQLYDGKKNIFIPI